MRVLQLLLFIIIEEDKVEFTVIGDVCGVRT